MVAGLVLVTAPLCAQPAPPAPRPPTFRSGVELITVDAVVLDKDGRPVSGLTREDFVVKEEGRPREIVSFESFVAGATEEAADETPAAVGSNEPDARGAGRAFALVIDDLSLAPDQIASARAAAATFVERHVRDADLVTVATTSGDAWWSARIPEGRADLLAILDRVRGRRVDVPIVERMTEYEAFWVARYEDSPSVSSLAPGSSVALPGRASGSAAEPAPAGSIKERVKQRWQQANVCLPIYCDSLVRSRAAEIDAARRARVRFGLACVRRALEALATVRGRKSLLFFSPGFLQDPGSDARAVAAASREANTAIYFVDARGLVALPGYGSAAEPGQLLDPRERTAVAFEEATVESEGARALASDTGGFSVRNTNDPSAGAWRVAAESRVFYLLGFYPGEGGAGRSWRNLHVEVARTGLSVRARRGYSLRSELASAAQPRAGREDPRAGSDPAVARALDSAHEEAGIPLRTIVYLLEPRGGGRVHVLVAAELDATAVARAANGVARLEVSVATEMRDGGVGFRQDAEVSIGSAARDEPTWRALTREFDLAPGVAQVRVVVRDPAGGAIGSVLQRVEIPFPGELRTSTPILTDRVETGQGAGERPRPALAAHRSFPAGGGLYCQYEVFGAARPGGASPRVAASLSLRSADGTVVREAPTTPIAADADGRVVRLVGASLEGLPVGPYELVIEGRDETTGQRFAQREHFRIEPAAAR